MTNLIVVVLSLNVGNATSLSKYIGQIYLSVLVSSSFNLQVGFVEWHSDISRNKMVSAKTTDLTSNKVVLSDQINLQKEIQHPLVVVLSEINPSLLIYQLVRKL